MQNFECLKKNPLSGDYFLEASAGCGKTFAIEHVLTRTILDGVSLDQILITTFTKAGARDLKMRIHKNLLSLLECARSGWIDAPEYLEADDDGKIKNFLALWRASSQIDTAEIFTIHSFCQKMLTLYSFESGSLFDGEMEKQKIEQSLSTVATLDVLRKISSQKEFSPAQLNILTKPFNKQLSRLLRSVKSQLYSSIPPLPSYETSHKEFFKALSQIDTDIYKNFENHANNYKNACNRLGEMHPHLKKQVDALKCGDFEYLIQTKPSIFEIFHETNLKKSAAPHFFFKPTQ